MNAPALELRDVVKVYAEGGGVRGLSLTVRKAEIAVLVGPSGCGKTTALRLAAGLVIPSSGKVFVGGVDVTGSPPERRGLGVVFQHYALFPHLTAESNVAYGLKARGIRGEELRRKVDQAIGMVGLGPKGGRRLDELSGGEQQRVAVARAIAFDPPVLLLDEPLSNLDLALRRRTREELSALVKRLGLAALHVTHDQEEALAIADALYVIRDGKSVQSGPPEDVYERPTNAFAARFLGGATVLRAVIGDDGAAVTRGGFRFPLSGDPQAGSTVDLALRPERLRLDPPKPEGPSAEIVSRTFAGGDVVFGLDLGGDAAEARVRSDAPSARFKLRDKVGVSASGAVHSMPIEPGP